MTVRRENCLDHSGIHSRLDGGLVLLAAICSLLGYQIFIQVPNLREELRVTVQKLDSRVAVIEKELLNIKAQRNADHPELTPLR